MMEKIKVKLNLVGVNGNAFAIMGAFKGAAKEQGWSKERIREVLDEAISSDYDHLLHIILKNVE